MRKLTDWLPGFAILTVFLVLLYGFRESSPPPNSEYGERDEINLDWNPPEEPGAKWDERLKKWVKDSSAEAGQEHSFEVGDVYVTPE